MEGKKLIPYASGYRVSWKDFSDSELGDERHEDFATEAEALQHDGWGIMNHDYREMRLEVIVQLKETT